MANYDTKTGNRTAEGIKAGVAKGIDEGGSVGELTRQAGSLTNPASSSNSYRGDLTATRADISGLERAYRQEMKMWQQQQAALAERRVNEIAGIKSEFDVAKTAQEAGQKYDYAGRATSLATSGGGFLGATQSQEGVLQNLKGTHEAERTALMAKRESAINAANAAYEDKDFALAKEMANSAKEYQKILYSREQDYNDQVLKMAQENRAQTEFDMGMTEKKIEGYANMSDEEFKNINPSDFEYLDRNYFSGYTKSMREVVKKERDVKTMKDQMDIDTTILDMRLKMPAGKKFQLNGVTYTGMKTNESGMGTQADRDMANKQKVQSWFTSATKIPGTDGVPFLDNTGKATPEGWQTAYEYSGMDRRKFIQEFSYLLRSSGTDGEGNPKYDNYGLVPSEIKLVNTLIPVNY